MTTTSLHQESPQDRFGRRIAARLNTSAELPYEISERLRAARVQALESRKPEKLLRRAPQVVGVNAGGAATLGWGDSTPAEGGGRSWWQLLLASALPICVLLIGLMVISDMQDDTRAREVADVDTALLTDDLPPAAYADPGFLQYLKSENGQNN